MPSIKVGGKECFQPRPLRQEGLELMLFNLQLISCRQLSPLSISPCWTQREAEDNKQNISSTSDPEPSGSEWGNSFNDTSRVLEFQTPHNPTGVLTVESNNSTDEDEAFNFCSSLDANNGFPLDTNDESPSWCEAPENPLQRHQGKVTASVMLMQNP
jgi:hypothetical protein